jgi:rhodanese-related sulfurtransferase
MDIAAIALAAIALIVALAVWSRASALGSRVGELERGLRRLSEGGGDKDLDANVANLRQMVAALAAHEPLTRDMVLNGQLWRDVDPREAQKLVEAGQVNLVDVRTPGETSGGIIPGALLIPVDELEQRQRELPRNGKSTLVYCAGGGRSAAACEMLSAQGFSGMLNLTGGFNAWSGARVKP